MVKAYLTGTLSATLAVLLVAVIWLGAQEQEQQPGLLWGDRVYTSKQEFKGYLKSKGLSYKIWLGRNPGVAPWEPGKFTLGPVTVRASTKAREDWVVRLPLAALALMVVTGCALLGLRLLRTVMPSLATRSVAFLSAVVPVLLVVAIWVATPPRREPRLGGDSGRSTSKNELKGDLTSKGRSYKTAVVRNPGAAPEASTAVRASTKSRGGWLIRLLLAAVGLMVATACALLLLPWLRALRPRFARGSLAFSSPSPPRSGRRSTGRPTASASIQRLGVAVAGVARPIRGAAPLYVERLIGAARADARLLSKLMRERNISVSDVAFGLLAATTAIMLALFVVFLVPL